MGENRVETTILEDQIFYFPYCPTPAQSLIVLGYVILQPQAYPLAPVLKHIPVLSLDTVPICYTSILVYAVLMLVIILQSKDAFEIKVGRFTLKIDLPKA